MAEQARGASFVLSFFEIHMDNSVYVLLLGMFRSPLRTNECFHLLELHPYLPHPAVPFPSTLYIALQGSWPFIALVVGSLAVS
jgi:hypothetical protein